MDNLPTRDELRQLPMRAMIAYAARCARRIQSSYEVQQLYPEAILHPIAVERAIQTAEKFALGMSILNPWSAAAAARSAIIAAGATAGATAAMAAANAAIATAIATQAADATWVVWATSLGTSVEAARRDFNHLRGLGLGHFPKLGEPIDPSENGPLGPRDLQL